MLTFPLNDDASLIVIEPGNLARMKKGKPLRVGNHLVCFTPDLLAFAAKIGIGEQAKVGPGEVRTGELVLLLEDLEAALRECLTLPEVLR